MASKESNKSIIEQVITPLTSRKNIKKLSEGMSSEEKSKSPDFTSSLNSVTKTVSDTANSIINTFTSKSRNDEDIEKNNSGNSINIGSSLKPRTPSVKKTEKTEITEESKPPTSIFSSFNMSETLSPTQQESNTVKTNTPFDSPTSEKTTSPFSPLNTISNATSQVSETIGDSAKSVSNMASMATAATMASASNLAVNATTSLQKKSHVKTFVMLLLGISLCILGYNLYLFMTERQDIFKKFFNFDFIQPRKVVKHEDKQKMSKLFSSKPEIPKTQVEKKIKAPLVNDQRKKEKRENTYEPDSHMDSSIQASAKKGWCYIGTDRGYRSCVELEANKCLSGDIFPSKDICINPSLRFE